jgi:hypothetical protein
MVEPAGRLSACHLRSGKDGTFTFWFKKPQRAQSTQRKSGEALCSLCTLWLQELTKKFHDRTACRSASTEGGAPTKARFPLMKTVGTACTP